MIETALLMMLGLELKHFVADYLLQSRWILSGKGDFRHCMKRYAPSGRMWNMVTFPTKRL